MEVCGMEVIERGKGVKKSVGLILVPVGTRHKLNDGLQIFNHMSVAINDDLGICRGHSNSSLQIDKAPTGARLSRLYGLCSGRCGRSIRDSSVGYSFRLAAEPRLIKLVIDAVLLQEQQGLIDTLSMATIRGKNYAIALFAKNRTNNLRFAFAFVRSMVKEDRRVVNHRVCPPMVERFIGLLNLGELCNLNIMLTQILRRRAALHRGDPFSRQVLRAVNVSA